MRDNILLALPMLQLLIVFTFGKPAPALLLWRNVKPALVNLPSGAEDINHLAFLRLKTGFLLCN